MPASTQTCQSKWRASVGADGVRLGQETVPARMLLAVGTSNHRTDRVKASNVRFPERNLGCHVGQVLRSTRGKVVNDLNRALAQCEQATYQCGANESRSASHNIFLHDSLDLPSNKLGVLTFIVLWESRCAVYAKAHHWSGVC